MAFCQVYVGFMGNSLLSNRIASCSSELMRTLLSFQHACGCGEAEELPQPASGGGSGHSTF